MDLRAEGHFRREDAIIYTANLWGKVASLVRVAHLGNHLARDIAFPGANPLLFVTHPAQCNEAGPGESHSSWKGFLMALKERGLHGVRLAITDDHAGLKKALREVLPESIWQRCYVHFLRQRPRSPSTQGRRRLLAGATLDV